MILDYGSLGSSYRALTYASSARLLLFRAMLSFIPLLDLQPLAVSKLFAKVVADEEINLVVLGKQVRGAHHPCTPARRRCGRVFVTGCLVHVCEKSIANLAGNVKLLK